MVWFIAHAICFGVYCFKTGQMVCSVKWFSLVKSEFRTEKAWLNNGYNGLVFGRSSERNNWAQTTLVWQNSTNHILIRKQQQLIWKRGNKLSILAAVVDLHLFSKALFASRLVAFRTWKRWLWLQGPCCRKGTDEFAKLLDVYCAASSVEQI